MTLLANAAAVRNGEGMMNDIPLQHSMFVFFSQMVCPVWKYASWEALEALSRIVFVVKWSYFCISHSCILKLVIVVGNGLFVKTGSSARNLLFPAFFGFLGVGLGGSPPGFVIMGKICFHWSEKIFGLNVFSAQKPRRVNQICTRTKSCY